MEGPVHNNIMVMTKEQRKKWWPNYYAKNKERLLAKNKSYPKKLVNSWKKAHKKRTISWFIKYKNTLKCKFCQEDTPICLDFHHLNPREKDRDISSMVAVGMSKKRIMDEINKCIVVCANCHRKINVGLINAGGEYKPQIDRSQDKSRVD